MWNVYGLIYVLSFTVPLKSRSIALEKIQEILQLHLLPNIIKIQKILQLHLLPNIITKDITICYCPSTFWV